MNLFTPLGGRLGPSGYTCGWSVLLLAGSLPIKTIAILCTTVAMSNSSASCTQLQRVRAWNLTRWRNDEFRSWSFRCRVDCAMSSERGFEWGAYVAKSIFYTAQRSGPLGLSVITQSASMMSWCDSPDDATYPLTCLCNRRHHSNGKRLPRQHKRD